MPASTPPDPSAPPPIPHGSIATLRSLGPYLWPRGQAGLKVRVVAAWCELRVDYRTFRLDRISHMEPLPDRYPRRRAQMLKEWREREGIPTPRR